MLQASLLRIAPLALLIAAAGCDTGEGASLYDPDRTPIPDPVVASIQPQGVVLAGIDEITIAGSNFSPNADENLVFFGDARAEVLSASPTELRVAAPNTPGEDLVVRVSVRGAEAYSNAVRYTLSSARIPFGELSPGTREEVRAMTSDGDGGLYVSFLSEGRSRGIVRFARDGTRALYHPSSAVWSGVAIGDEGPLYGARRVQGVFTLPENEDAEVLAIVDRGIILATLAPAPNGGVYAGGSTAIYYVSPGGTATPTPFADPVVDMTVFDGALYVAAVTSTSSRVHRFQLNGDGSLGAGSVYYDLTAAEGPGVSIAAIELAADGTLYLGTNAPDPIFEVLPDGSSSVLYPGVLSPPVSNFAWGEGTTLFVSTAFVPPAALDGPSTAATLYALNTRRQAP